MMWSVVNLAPGAIEEAVERGQQAAGHHVPVIAEWVNHLFGSIVYSIQQAIMPTFYGWFGAGWQGNPEMPIPTHVVMFFIALFISTIILRWVMGRLSVENPSGRQQIFELMFEGLHSLMKENIGPHYMRYFPVIGMLAVLIGVCNLMGLIPFLEAPTANFNVPLALAVLSFLYYNYVGIRENGPLGHLRHFAGPVAAIAIVFFPI
ncbi:MAG: F0F1 ATP synthase subunit A, partial [bacterium]